MLDISCLYPNSWHVEISILCIFSLIWFELEYIFWVVFNTDSNLWKCSHIDIISSAIHFLSNIKYSWLIWRLWVVVKFKTDMCSIISYTVASGCYIQASSSFCFRFLINIFNCLFLSANCPRDLKGFLLSALPRILYSCFVDMKTLLFMLFTLYLPKPGVNSGLNWQLTNIVSPL